MEHTESLRFWSILRHNLLLEKQKYSLGLNCPQGAVPERHQKFSHSL